MKVSVTSKRLQRFGFEVLPGVSSHHWTPLSFTRKATGQLLIRRQTNSIAQTQRFGAIRLLRSSSTDRKRLPPAGWGAVTSYTSPAEDHRGDRCRPPGTRLPSREAGATSPLQQKGTSQLNKATSLASDSSNACHFFMAFRGNFQRHGLREGFLFLKGCIQKV